MCEGTVLFYTRSACSRGYKRGERGREAPKSLLEVESGMAMVVNVSDDASRPESSDRPQRERSESESQTDRETERPRV